LKSFGSNNKRKNQKVKKTTTATTTTLKPRRLELAEKGRGIGYSYLDLENLVWAKEQCFEYNQSLSYVMDRCLYAARTSTPVTFEHHTPRYLLRATKAKERSQKRLDEARKQILRNAAS
jgi:hypothetical protein